MSTIIAGRFDEEEKARHAYGALESAGFPRDQITSFYLTPPGQHALHGTTADPDASAGAHHAGGGAIAGAAAGTGVGAVIGLATVPMLGPVAPVVTAAIGAYVGSLAGAVRLLEYPEHSSGGVGHSDVRHQEKPPRKSGFMVAATAENPDAQTSATEVLAANGAQDVERADGTIINGKWDNFDPLQPPVIVRASQ